MKKVLLLLTLCLVLLCAVLLVNTLRFTSRQVQVEPVRAVGVDEGAAAERLAQALRIQTVSYQDGAQTSGDAFLALHRHLEQAYPKTHATLGRELVSGYSLLYTWKGRNEKLKPVLLAAHQDVVPVEPETARRWSQPPFEGRISDGFVWGRGALDDKSGVLGLLEAVELLLGENFQPERTIYFAFGEDEEVGGELGAARVAELLRQRGVELEYVLDEGLAITEGILPDIDRPVALIGVAEKGHVSVELSAEVEGGHSSMPPQQTAIGILSAAVNRLEANQMPASIEGVQRQTFEHLGPEMPFGKRLVMANLWLFKPLVVRLLSASPSSNAAIRTTTAVTIIEGGLKENVLPSRARAVVNFRILPGDSVEGVLAHVRETVNDTRIRIAKFGTGAREPSAVSSTDTQGYQTVQKTIRQVFPETLVAPALVVAGTDSRHYSALTNHIYRFLPMRVRPEDVKRLHGVDERISVADYAGFVKFYYHLIRNSAQ